jgi:DNA-binding CsgD family transcriptional regulator
VLNDVDLWIKLSRDIERTQKLLSDLSIERDLVLLRLKTKGISNRQLADELGVSGQLVWQLTRRANSR